MLLAEAFRGRRTGLLVLGAEASGEAVTARLEAGQIVALGVAAPKARELPSPNDSVKLRLERVLLEVGVRKVPPQRAPAPVEGETLRERLIDRLADPAAPAHFVDSERPAAGLVASAVQTEPVILEAVRRMRQDEAVRSALGDLDAPLVATPSPAEERTLTLTEGYLLSRIDGLLSVRQVLELVPFDPREAQRWLLGLLLTGRLACRAPRPVAAVDEPGPEAETVAMPPVAPGAELAAAGNEPAASAEAVEPAVEEELEVVSAEELAAGAAEPTAETEIEAIPDDEYPAPASEPARPNQEQGERPALDAATIERRREILEFFQALPLRNHFEVLGVEPGCTDADVRRAYVALAKKFHPDANRDVRLYDMHDIMEAVFIRIGEAWEVLGESRSRASYEARSGIVRRPAAVVAGAVPPEASRGAAAAAPVASPPSRPEAASEPPEYLPAEEILFRAKLMLSQARYWDAIQTLETALPNMEPRASQHRGRVLLARAYSKNPNWLRKAEEILQALVKEDPTNADAHFELGMVYKSSNFPARAQGMFRRALELRPNHKDAAAELGIELRQPGAPEPGGIFSRFFKRGKAS